MYIMHPDFMKIFVYFLQLFLVFIVEIMYTNLYGIIKTAILNFYQPFGGDFLNKDNFSNNTNGSKKPFSSSGKRVASSSPAKRKNKKMLFAVIVAVLFLAGIISYFALGAMVSPPASDVVVDNPNVTEITQKLPDTYSILIAGCDKIDANTDTIFIAHINVKEQTVNILNIPRDTMSNVERKIKKINAAYYVGGKGNIDQLKKEVRDVTGFDVDRYAVINVDVFEEIVDTIGGVTIDVPQNMNYEDPTQGLSIHIKKGEQVLDGKTAIGFVRYRSGYADGDLGRVRAQQLFLKAVAKQVVKAQTIPKFPKLASLVSANTHTDLSVGEMIWLATTCSKFDMEDSIQTYTLPGSAGYYGGLSYYIVNEEETLKLVNECFNPYDTPIKSLNLIKVSGSGGGSSGSGKSSSKPKEEKPPETSPPAESEPEPAETDPAEDDPAASEETDPEETKVPEETTEPAETGDPVEPVDPSLPEIPEETTAPAPDGSETDTDQ